MEREKNRDQERKEKDNILPDISEYLICLDSFYSLIYSVFNTMLGIVVNSKEAEDALYSITVSWLKK